MSNAKKVSLELGGKSPLIIFGDCDLDKAVRQVSLAIQSVDFHVCGLIGSIGWNYLCPYPTVRVCIGCWGSVLQQRRELHCSWKDLCGEVYP